VAGICLVALAFAANTQSQTVRGDNWEATIQMVYSGAKDNNGKNDSFLDVDSDVGFGLGIAYNFDSRFALGFDFTYLKPRYTAQFNTEEDGLVQVKHKMSVYSGQFNGTWNIIDGPLTPYLQLGVGWTDIDSNVSDGPPVTGCWWDPWWGYICRNYYSTYSESNLSWGYGAGVRFEFAKTMFVKASINRVEIDAKGSSNYDTAKLELGWMF